MLARAPRFWDRSGSTLGTLLTPLGWLVGAITLRRMAQPGVGVGVPVLCIGNPTVGGSGKTPTVIAVLAALSARGARPYALLRGHGGREHGPLQVDPALHDAHAVGDEALLLARHAPTIVARDRVAGARLALAQGASHVVMDDGFQNPALVKDASLLVLDGRGAIGNGQVLPAGPLRAPMGPQVARADAVLIVGEGEAGRAAADAAGAEQIWSGRLAPAPAAARALRGQRLLAFAGIGRPEKFFATLSALGADVVETHAFPDHHPYTPAHIAALIRRAQSAGLTAITTEKDMVRLSDSAFAALRPDLHSLPVRMVLDDALALNTLIERAEAAFAARQSLIQLG